MMLDFSLPFLAHATLFLGIAAISFLDFGTDTDPDSEPDVTGTDGDDAFDNPFGTAGFIDLAGGDDTLSASDGADTVAAGDGEDEVAGRQGDDMVQGGAGNDLLDGNFGDDTLEGGSGADRLSGQSGADVLSGGDGTDWLRGGEGDDVLIGGAGDDLLEGGEGADQLQGGTGNDTLNGTYDEGTLSKTVDPDGADTLEGGAGDDRLILGAGDLATGGDGADAFALDEVLARDDAPDQAGGPAAITDFDPDADALQIEIEGGGDPGLLSIQDFEDGTGATIFYDGAAVAEVTGAQGLDPAEIALVAV